MNELTQYSLVYRPRKWEDIYGQETTVKALVKRLKNEDYPSSILLQGPFGCGKSTIAELFAACLVSPTLDEGMNPDWNSPSCKAISNGSFDRDVIRLDGAQLSGKSDVVDFFKGIDTRPLYDKRKVILVEESDQISQAGMSSLLKILEGLKPYVTVILLSMEDKGVPAAIKSRCQVYKINSLGVKDIMLNLKNIMEKTGDWTNKNIPDTFRLEGLSTIASSANGSMRSAVQYLEQCIVNESWTAESISKLLDVVTEELSWKILDGLLDKSKDETMWNTLIWMKTGEPLNHFLNYTTMMLAEALIANRVGVVCQEANRNRLERMGKNSNCEKLYNYLSCNPQMLKPYVKTSDLLGVLSEYYKDDKEVIKQSVKNETKDSVMKIGNSEVGEKLIKREFPEIKTRPPKVDLSKLDITF